MGLTNLLVGIWLDLTYSLSMKDPVAPQSNSARTPCFRWVSGLSISTCKYKDFGPGSVAAMVNLFGRRLSQRGSLFSFFEGSILNFGVSDVSAEASCISSTANTSYRLFRGSWGTPFTCCLPENPLPHPPTLPTLLP